MYIAIDIATSDIHSYVRAPDFRRRNRGDKMSADKYACRPPVVLAAMALAAAVLAVPMSTRADSPSGGGTLERILKDGVIRIGTIVGDAPFVDIGADGQLEGYEIDLANELGKRMGVKVQFVQTDVAGRVTTLQSGKVDAVFADFSVTTARAMIIDFTDAYVVEGARIMTTTQNNYNSFADLNKTGVKIGMDRGGSDVPIVKQLIPNAEVVEFTGPADAIGALAAGQVDAVATNDVILALAIKAHPDQLKFVPGYLLRQINGIGVPKGDLEWLQFMNTFIAQVNADGTNYALWEKWIGGTPPPFVSK